MELTGKVALVTGAGTGIGKAAAVLLAQQGAQVAALSHTADEVEQTVAERANSPGRGETSYRYGGCPACTISSIRCCQPYHRYGSLD
jgi:NAD(P)-dependent dehydrogenase (short-subunit alcohol dehydrogenase family)